jgi:hypothetical protein
MDAVNEFFEYCKKIDLLNWYELINMGGMNNNE